MTSTNAVTMTTNNAPKTSTEAVMMVLELSAGKGGEGGRGRERECVRERGREREMKKERRVGHNQKESADACTLTTIIQGAHTNKISKPRTVLHINENINLHC